MALHVHLPIRLRLDADAFDEAGAAMDEALAGALDRALRRAGEVALDRRAGRRMVVHRTPVHWHGASVGAIGIASRQQAERRVEEVLATALDRHLPGRDGDRPEVLPRGPAETFDAARFADEAYAVDSYLQTGRRRPGQSVFWFKNQDEANTILTQDSVGNWWDFTTSEELAELAVRLSADARAAGALRSGESFGLLFRRRHLRGAPLWVAMFHSGPGGEVVPAAVFPIGTPATWDVKPRKNAKKGATPTAQSMAVLPLGTFALRPLPAGKVYDAMLSYWKVQLGIPEGHELWPRLQKATRNIVASTLHPDGAAALLVTASRHTVSITVPAGVIDDELTLLPVIRVHRKPDVAEEATEGEGGADGSVDAKDAKGEAGGGAKGKKKGEGGGGSGKGAGSTGGAGQEGGTGQDGGTGQGAGTGGQGDPDAIIRSDKPGTQGGSLLPAARIRGKAPAADLSAFEGEPPVDALGDIGRRMRLLIQRIAFRLEMEEGRFAGAFALAAAQVVGGRATGAADYGVGEGQARAPALGADGNLGTLQFEVGDSQAIRVMRHLAATVPLIAELARLASSVAQDRNYRGLFANGAPDGGSWSLHFLVRYRPQIETSVAWIFVSTSQVILLQLTAATRVGLVERQMAGEKYFQLVDSMLRNLFSGDAELRDLREQLKSHLGSGTFKGTVREGYQSWRSARSALSSALGTNDQSEEILRGVDRSSTKGVIRDLPEGGAVIKDGQDHEWTLAELEQAIALRFELAASVDPIIKHVSDVPVAVVLFKTNPTAARAWLEALLKELLTANRNVTAKAEESAIWAFRCSRLHEDLESPPTIPGTSVQLGGIHKLAYDAIGDAFFGDSTYVYALDHLFSHELGRTSLIEFLAMAGPLALGVICPPLGAVVGIGVAAVRYYFALEDQDIPKAILDPDLVLSREEAEMELFMAEFELVLSLIPEVGTILAKSLKIGTTLARSGVKAGTRIALRRLRREFLVAVAKQLRQDLPVAFAKAVTNDQIGQYVIGKVLEPAFAEVIGEIRFDATGSSGMEKEAKQPDTVDGGEPLTPTELRLLEEIENTPEEPAKPGGEP